MIGRIARISGTALLFLIVFACLALTIVPRLLDARYYRGPASGHFDGERFRNPDRDDRIDGPVAGPVAGPGAGRRSGLPWRMLLGTGAPPWPDHVAVAAKPVPARVMGQEMIVTWVGHATLLVQTQGLNILTDPIWSARAGPLGIGPARVAEPGIAFDRLPRIDLVLVSHNHYDHMDLATLKKLWLRDRPLIVTSLGNDGVIGQAGIPRRATDSGPGVEALDWGDFTLVRHRPWLGDRAPAPVHVGVVRNHHWSTRWASDRNRALWSAFVVRLPGGNLFFAGDTGAGDRQWAAEAARYGPVRLALIPIGAFRFSPGQMSERSHIGPVDAVEVARQLGASRAIGMHWGTFRLSSEGYDTPPRLLAAAMACTGQGGQFDTIPIGQPQRIAPYRPPELRPAMAREALLACLDTPAVRALR